MRKRPVVPVMFCSCGLAALSACASTSTSTAPTLGEAAAGRPSHGPVPVIYDTDIGLDIDDVGGLALLHALADRGEATILGVMVSESIHNYDGLWGPPLVDIINTYYRRPDVPVGVYKGTPIDIGRYGHFAEPVVKAKFPHKLVDAWDAEDATSVYRRVLAAAADDSVVVVTAGYLTNLYGLMVSTPDAISPLTGMELVGRKVREWVCSGGRYPSSGRTPDLNFGHYPEQAEYVINRWPGKVTFGGDELADSYLTGARVSSDYEAGSNPVAMAWHHHNGGKPQPSRDSLAVLYAIRGSTDTTARFFPKVEGGANHYQKVDEYVPSGKLPASQNVWLTDVKKPHGYLKAASANEDVSALLDELIAAPPAQARPVQAQE